MNRDVHSGFLKRMGEENSNTLSAAISYAVSLNKLNRCGEVKALLRKTLPVARRVLGERNEFMLRMRQHIAEALYKDGSATLSDLREAVNTLEETERTARRVMGGAHPMIEDLEGRLRESRAALSSREASRETVTPSG